MLPLLAPFVFAVPIPLPSVAQVPGLTLVSRTPAGIAGDWDSSAGVASADGRWVAFTSNARNLVGLETTLDADVYLADLWNGGSLQRISRTPTGGEGNGDSYRLELSADGRFVAFTSAASNLTTPGGNGLQNVFVHDTHSGVTTLASASLAGGYGNSVSDWISVSDDGRFAAFVSRSSNLVAGDTNNREDVFVRDLALGQTTRVSLTAAGAEATWTFQGPFTGDTCMHTDISSDGRFVVFGTLFALVPGDVNNAYDVYLFDRTLQSLELISVGIGLAPADSGSNEPHVSDDGRRVLFASAATNLVPNDFNSTADVFLRDRQAATTRCLSLEPNGTCAGQVSSGTRLSPNGGYAIFGSSSSSIDPGDPNAFADLFLVDIAAATTTRVVPGGLEPNSVSLTGHVGDFGLVVLTSAASNLAPGDTNTRFDVYAWNPDIGRPVSYCTSGTSGQGCVGRLTATGRASLSSCTLALHVDGVNAQKQGLLLYGLSGANALPWGASSSFLCIDAPRQRTAVAQTGGTPGACDGAWSFDWCSFVATNPGALGLPITAGDTFHAQAWYRDPAGTPTSAFTNALRWLY